VTLSTADRLDILELLARADNAATRRDTAAYVSLFAEDGVLEGEKGEHRGRRALAEAVGPIWASEGAASVHVTSNAVIDAFSDRPDQATATSNLIILDPGPPVVIRSVSVIVQQVVRTGPTWSIARRRVSTA
jgi:hypothetical protein